MRSYPHAHSLDFINYRGCDLHRIGAGLGRRGYVGFDRRLTLSAGLTSDRPCMTPGRPLVSPGVVGCDGPADRRQRTARLPAQGSLPVVIIYLGF